MESIKQTISGWLSQFTGKENLWIIETFLVVLATLIAALVLGVFLRRLQQKAEKTKTIWDDALFHSLIRPAKWFVWVFGLSTAAALVARYSESALLDSIASLRHVAYIVIFIWFLTTFISRAEKNLMDPEYAREPMDQTTASAIGKLLRISVIITGSLVALQSMGYSISGVLAFGGIGGIAVGFAAKDMLANFFGGLVIYLDRPFAVGDWVRSPDREIEGTVEDIGWRQTRIRTFDKRPLYVPNSTFTQVAVENPSRMQARRIFETVGIRYDDAAKMRSIVTEVKNMVREHPDINTDLTIIVAFNKFAASSLDFMVYCFTKTVVWVEYHDIKQDVMLKVIDIIESYGAECAFPTSTLHIPEEVSVKQLAADRASDKREGGEA